MGTVTDLSSVRADRDRTSGGARAAAAAGIAHPALRWLAGDVYDLAHHKIGGRAACGAVGDLSLALAAVPLCTECFPHQRQHRDAQ